MGEATDPPMQAQTSQEQRSCQEMPGEDGKTSRSISSIRVGGLGCSKLIPGATLEVHSEEHTFCQFIDLKCEM